MPCTIQATLCLKKCQIPVTAHKCHSLLPPLSYDTQQSGYNCFSPCMELWRTSPMVRNHTLTTFFMQLYNTNLPWSRSLLEKIVYLILWTLFKLLVAPNIFFEHTHTYTHMHTHIHTHAHPHTHTTHHWHSQVMNNGWVWHEPTCVSENFLVRKQL